MAALSETTHTSGMPVSVLIVDDDEGFVRVASELLHHRGYRVVGQANCAQEAMTRAAELKPNAVLLDVHLPDQDGVSVAAELSRHEQPPLVLLTSSDRRAVDEDLVRSCDAVGFVAKAELPTADLDAYLRR
jgi:CheY-like chemotaxis protein